MTDPDNFFSPIHCVSNYTCNSDSYQELPESDHSYNYWNQGVYIKLSGNRSFDRGDRIRILGISSPSETECVIRVEKAENTGEAPGAGEASNPASNPGTSDGRGELPWLMIVSCSFPLDPDDNYRLVHGAGVRELRTCRNSIYGNHYQTSALLVTGDSQEISLVNGEDRKVCEWRIEDSNRSGRNGRRR